VVRRAFADPARHDDEEAAIVIETWNRNAVPDGLDLVADDGGDIVGHVMAGRGQLAGREALGVAPLSVAPDRQRQGIGTALMNAVLERADVAGWPFVLLLGEPAYYERFGFEPAGALGIVYAPVGPGSAYFQIKRLRAFERTRWQGTFSYCWELPSQRLGRKPVER
jgi:putative acetyltransferase